MLVSVALDGGIIAEMQLTVSSMFNVWKKMRRFDAVLSSKGFVDLIAMSDLAPERSAHGTHIQSAPNGHHELGTATNPRIGASPS